MSIWTKAFWRAAAERAVKTFAQTEAALLTADGTGLLDSDWQTSLSVSAMAAVISVLTSIGSDGLTGGSGPSLGAEVTAETVSVTAPQGSTVTTTTEAPPADDPSKP